MQKELLVQGNNQGELLVWKIDDFVSEPPPTPRLSLSNDTSPFDLVAEDVQAASVLVPQYTASIKALWTKKELPRSPFFHSHVTSGMTVAILIDQEFIVHGYADGTVMISSIFTIAQDYIGRDRPLLSSTYDTEEFQPPPHTVLRGHSG